jgi:Fur family ferric uptake transcriptional regulator
MNDTLSHIQKKHHQIIQREKQRFTRYLSRSGLKFSAGRKALFEEAMKAHGHFAAEELVKQCRHNQRQVSRATIYRGLRELVEAGIIRVTAFGEKHKHYEHVYDEKLHHHARCIRCGSIIEIICFHEEHQYLPLLKKHDFNILGHELHFYGICRYCQGADKNTIVGFE